VAGTLTTTPEISVEYAGLPFCQVAYSGYDIPSEMFEASNEMCIAAYAIRLFSNFKLSW
jgi:hypothetical protein